MNQKRDLRAIRQKLEELRAGLHEQIQNEKIRLCSAVGASPDLFDLAQDYFSNQLGISLLRQTIQRLEQVETALQRMDEDAYGLCIQCSASIDPSRLRAFPYALTCIECQERRERSVATNQRIQNHAAAQRRGR